MTAFERPGALYPSHLLFPARRRFPIPGEITGEEDQLGRKGKRQRNNRLFGWYYHFDKPFLKRSPFLLADTFVKTLSWLFRLLEIP